MKNGIHPKLKRTIIACACGTKIETYSTAGNYGVEICSQCHPFFTGKKKLIDTEGRVERFNKKYAKMTKPAAAAK